MKFSPAVLFLFAMLGCDESALQTKKEGGKQATSTVRSRSMLKTCQRVSASLTRRLEKESQKERSR